MLRFAIHFLLLCCAVSLGVGAARGESPRGLNNAGVEAYMQKDYEAALGKFEAAREQAPHDPRLDYNLGVTRAAQEKTDEALEDLARAGEAREESLRRRARFAEGVVNYLEAQRRAEQGDSQGALETVRAAIDANRSLLLSDPTDVDARTNFEIATRLKDEIEKQLQQQQQQSDNKDEQEKKDEDRQEQEQNQQQQEDRQESQEEKQDRQDQESQEKQERSEQEKNEQSQPEATPTPQPEQGQQPESQEPDEAEPTPSASREPQPTEQADSGEDATESVLNLLEDNDNEALKRMLRLRYGHLPQPDKDW
ncbi:hypothetical protein JW916_09545 [Candidatus Sumerlaeota bacterium]|nr:hypothetical protein [Candidatus Sumerlaeota bacterium]